MPKTAAGQKPTKPSRYIRQRSRMTKVPTPHYRLFPKVRQQRRRPSKGQHEYSFNPFDLDVSPTSPRLISFNPLSHAHLPPFLFSPRCRLLCLAWCQWWSVRLLQYIIYKRVNLIWTALFILGIRVKHLHKTWRGCKLWVLIAKSICRCINIILLVYSALRRLMGKMVGQMVLPICIRGKPHVN